MICKLIIIIVNGKQSSKDLNQHSTKPERNNSILNTRGIKDTQWTNNTAISPESKATSDSNVLSFLCVKGKPCTTVQQDRAPHQRSLGFCGNIQFPENPWRRLATQMFLHSTGSVTILPPRANNKWQRKGSTQTSQVYCYRLHKQPYRCRIEEISCWGVPMELVFVLTLIWRSSPGGTNSLRVRRDR